MFYSFELIGRGFGSCDLLQGRILGNAKCYYRKKEALFYVIISLLKRRGNVCFMYNINEFNNLSMGRLYNQNF